jgi:predicted restriction endonuclease
VHLILDTFSFVLDFSAIKIGKTYDRTWLTRAWNFRGYQAFSKGVFCPAGGGQIILFVTWIKQKSLEQYKDYISGEFLFWEGETRHGNDQRIINARGRGEAIHLFFREIHHSPFEYKGEVELVDHELSVNKPSKFVFRLFHDQGAEDDLATHQDELIVLPETERESVTKARIGQGIFRKQLLEMWDGCAVTGVKLPEVLRASHIKPWRDSTNAERTNRYNGLLLLPQYDHLFDKKLISFDDEGQILKSPVLDRIPLNQLGINESDRLRTLSKAHLPFLQYHRESMFVRFTEGDKA